MCKDLREAFGNQDVITDNYTPSEGIYRMNKIRTREYFLSELLAFRELMGQKSFWDPPEKAAAALRGLVCCYTKIDGLTESDRSFFFATCIEYDRRLAYCLMGC